MKVEEQVCSLIQAKKLKELGIEQNSLFYWIDRGNDSKVLYGQNVEFLNSLPIVSAFTVAELGELLPTETYTQRTGSNNSEYANWEFTDDGNELGMGAFKTEAQARATLLIYLLENKLITPPVSKQ